MPASAAEQHFGAPPAKGRSIADGRHRPALDWLNADGQQANHARRHVVSVDGRRRHRAACSVCRQVAQRPSHFHRAAIGRPEDHANTLPVELAGPTLGAQAAAAPRRVGLEERVLVGADLLDVELVEAGVRVAPGSPRGARRGRGRTGTASATMLLGDELAGLLEVRGRRQDLRELAGQRLVGPQPVRGARAPAASSGPSRPSCRPATSLPSPPCVAEASDRFGVGRDRAEAVADPGRELDRLAGRSPETRIGGGCSGRS